VPIRATPSATIAITITLAALGLRLLLGLAFPNDEPDDGRLYTTLALNLLDHGVYSSADAVPYRPTYIRMPGYPLFLAAVHALAGPGGERAVRVVQALVDTATCWLVALLAAAWAPRPWGPSGRRRAALMGLALAAACPFTAVYVTTLLSETLTLFFGTAALLTASRALAEEGGRHTLAWWILTGAAAGLATQMRPDAGLYVAACGGTLLATALWGSGTQVGGPLEPPRRAAALTRGLALSLAFLVVLAPWTLRNWSVFGVLQPLAPLHASMPEEFVPEGYLTWLRTWVDDHRYIGPMEWALDLAPITLDPVPDRAFDSADERQRAARLLDRYNHPTPPPHPGAEKGPTREAGPVVQMTPAIDAGFARLAAERIARHPWRYYLLLPLERVALMWVDTHSEYFPFSGHLLPLADLDWGQAQPYWLVLFMVLLWGCTLLGAAGVRRLWQGPGTRLWLWLVALLVLPRLVLLSSLENPEPRYVVEFFPLLAALGGVALGRPAEPIARARTHSTAY
jgi:Dolichyl-phosphate-mannose-protein mannosyltransferase